MTEMATTLLELTPAGKQQVGLAYEILRPHEATEIPSTEGEVFMAKMLTTPKTSGVIGKEEDLEPTKKGVAVGFLTKDTDEKDLGMVGNFCEKGMVVLTAQVDFAGQKAYVAADKDGLSLIVAKEGEDVAAVMRGNFDKVSDPKKTVILSDSDQSNPIFSGIEKLKVIPINEEAAEMLFTEALNKSNEGPYLFPKSAGNKKDESFVEPDNNQSNIGRLKVLKLFQANLEVESDFEYVVPGTRGYNEFGRTNEESVTQINAITEILNSETDPLKKYACEIQLKICQKFLEEKRKLMPDIMSGENWKRYLEDKRGVLNFSEAKFVVKKDYRDGFIAKWNESDEKVKTALSTKPDSGYDPKVLEALIVDRVVATAVVSYLSNAKFDNTLKPISQQDLR